MAKFVIATVLMAFAVFVSATPRGHGWGRYRPRYDCSACFTDFGDFEECASLYSNADGACGTQGVKHQRREYVTGASADCLTKCNRYDLINADECEMTGQLVCTEQVVCDFSAAAADLPEACPNQVEPASTQYSLVVADPPTTGLALTVATGTEDIYGYYVSGTFQASETTPHRFCLQMTYQLPGSVVLKVLRLPEEFPISTASDIEMRRALYHHDHDHHYLIKDSRITNMAASETVSKSFEAEKDYRIAIVAFPPSGVTLPVDIVTSYSITEGKCPSTTA